MEPTFDAEPDSSDVLDKVDALLKKHRPTTAQPADAEMLAISGVVPQLPPQEDIPTLTDIVSPPPPAAPVAAAPVSGAELDEAAVEELLRSVEDFLVRELESRIAPQLSITFDRALNDLLERAVTHVGQAVRETIAQELRQRLSAAIQAEKRGE